MAFNGPPGTPHEPSVGGVSALPEDTARSKDAVAGINKGAGAAFGQPNAGFVGVGSSLPGKLRGHRVEPGRPSYQAAVRALAGGLRWRRFWSPDNLNGDSGEEYVIEAKGSILIPIPRNLSAHQCDTAPRHQHCTDVGVPRTVEHLHGAGEAWCCLILEKFPVSVHFAVPLRDPIIPGLGDNLVVTIEKRPYPLGVDYEHGPEAG